MTRIASNCAALVLSLCWLPAVQAADFLARIPHVLHDRGLPSIFLRPNDEARAEPLVTDRPDFTEASSTVGGGVVQLEAGYTFSYFDSEKDGTITRGHTIPEALWRIGITDRIELRIVWNYAWERNTEGGVTSFADGADDLQLGTKIAVSQQNHIIPESSVIFQSNIPTGGNEFTGHKTSFGINYLYSWELPNGWTLGASTGFDTATEFVPLVPGVMPVVEGKDDYVFWHQSATFAIPLNDRLGAYFEYFGLYKHAFTGRGTENYLNGGFTYLLNNDVQLDIRAGKGLNDNSDDMFAGAGISIRH